MSAADILTALADENGDLNVDDALDVLIGRAEQLQSEGNKLLVTDMIDILENTMAAAVATLVETVLLTQKSVVAAHTTINYLLTGDKPEVDFDIDEQRQIMLASFELDKMAQVVDTLERAAERDSDE